MIRRIINIVLLWLDMQFRNDKGTTRTRVRRAEEKLVQLGLNMSRSSCVKAGARARTGYGDWIEVTKIENGWLFYRILDIRGKPVGGEEHKIKLEDQCPISEQ